MNESNESLVKFTPYQKNGVVLDQIVLTYDAYYEGVDSPIDDSDWIARNGLIAIAIEVYGERGKLQSFSVNFYDSQGSCVSAKSVHTDGTVTSS